MASHVRHPLSSRRSSAAMSLGPRAMVRLNVSQIGNDRGGIPENLKRPAEGRALAGSAGDLVVAVSDGGMPRAAPHHLLPVERGEDERQVLKNDLSFLGVILDGDRGGAEQVVTLAAGGVQRMPHGPGARTDLANADHNGGAMASPPYGAYVAVGLAPGERLLAYGDDKGPRSGWVGERADHWEGGEPGGTAADVAAWWLRHEMTTVGNVVEQAWRKGETMAVDVSAR